MIVLQKAITPDGDKIQIEDWASDYRFHSFGDLLVAFPHRPGGSSYRAECQFPTYEDAKAALAALASGASVLDDFPFTSKKAGADIPFRDFRFND